VVTRRSRGIATESAELRVQDSDHVVMWGGIRAAVATLALCAACVATAVAPARASTPVTGPNPPGGGHAAPDGEGGSAAGDARLRRALIRAFRVAPHSLQPGQAARFELRLSGVRPGLRARVELRPAGGGHAVRVSLGRVRAGRRVSVRWKVNLDPGSSVARLVVVDRYGDLARHAGVARRARLRVVAPPPPPAPAPAPSPAPAPPSGDTAFPIAGPHDYGGPDSRFGADRGDHVHQGQDVSAAEGTPLVAPRPGTISTVAYQASGAGYYVIEADADGQHWYALMHMQKGSIVVTEGQQVSAGTRLGAVGSTGESSGPHLHFEEWVGPWQAGGQPVDPLPLLQSWDR
jgi:murein DD-endopeptidase MepM/ murein hydrolase activator NlpD